MMILTMLAMMSAVQGDPASAATGAKPAEPRRICKSVVQTGSRLRTKRVCMSEAELETEKELTRKMLDDARVRVGTER